MMFFSVLEITEPRALGSYQVSVVPQSYTASQESQFNGRFVFKYVTSSSGGIDTLTSNDQPWERGDGVMEKFPPSVPACPGGCC